MSRFRRTAFARLALAAAVAIFAACGGTEITHVDTTATPPPAKDTIPATVIAVGVLNQSGQVNAELPSPLMVVVRNKAGDVLKGVNVTFAVATGGGILGSPAVATDAQGQASSKWILGPSAGTQTATATVQGLAPVTFTAAATAGPATTIQKIAGDSQSVAVGTAVPIAPTVKILDAVGNPVSGVTVTFSAVSGGGSVAGNATVTGNSGTAHPGSWTLGPQLGTNTLQVTAGSLTTTFTATATAGAAASIQFTSTNPSQLTVSQTTQLTVRVLDANGNQITNVTPVFSSSNNNVATVDAQGTVTGIGTGQATITASVGSISANRVFTIVGHPGSVIYDTTALAQSPGPVVVAQGNAFVAQTTGTTVTRMANNGTIAAVIDIGGAPVDLAVDQGGATVVAANGSLKSLAILNLGANNVGGTVSLGATPTKVVLSHDGKLAYALLSNGLLAIVDVASASVTYIVNVGLTATAARLSAGDSILYVAGGNTLTAINVNVRLTRWTQSIAGSISDVEISPDGAYLYAANGTTGKVDIFNIATLGLVGSLDVGGGASAVTLTPDGQELYVVQQSLGEVTRVIVQTSRSLIPTRLVPTGGLPRRVAFEQTGLWGVITNANGWVNFIH